MTSPTLAVSALGPLEITLDGATVSGWQYLDSVELLLYLLLYTETIGGADSPKQSTDLHGKTKDQIGAALWPEASPSQVQANLKVRLRDLRRTLGARGWVLFETEQYKFNYTLPCAFDVRAFQNHIETAHKHLRANQADQALASLSQAVALYRGELLGDYRKRQSATRARFGDQDEIEWYVQQRYELQAVHRQALEMLGSLLMDQSRYVQAADTFRQLVAADEYDDTAHRRLMLALAYQGKRSQALQHYRRLIKQRADTPPDDELDALAEQIKRGEITARPQDSNQTTPIPAAAPVIPAPFQPPADLPRFVGRAAQLRSLRDAIAQSAQGQLFCIVGMGGIGKTTLALRLAHAMRDQFPDGVLWGHLAASEPLAILDSWARSFGCDYSALPDVETRAASLRSLLNDKKILFVLDDVWDAARVRPLLFKGAGHYVLMTSRSADIAAAVDAQIIPLPVLSDDESTDLFSHIVGTARVQSEPQAANEIGDLLGHLPLAIDITAHRLTTRPRWSLADMAERLRQQVQRLDELAFGDRAVRAAFEISWDFLPEAAQHIFSRLGIFEERSFAAPAAAAVAEREEPHVRQELDTLVALSLVLTDDDMRYHLHPLLADFAREKMQGYQSAQDNVAERFANYYLQFATQARQNYTALEKEWDNLNAGIELAQAHALWQTVIDYGDVLTDAWIARGRFSEARRAYPHVMQASRELEEQDPYIAASLNWGKACLDQSDYAEAETHLQHGLQTSREVNDAYAIGTAQFLLARLAVIQARFDEAEPRLAESEAQYQKVKDRAGLAQVYYMRARIHMTQGEYAAAEEWGKRSLEILNTLAPSHARIVMLRYMGRIYDYLENVDEAIKYCQEAVELAETMGDVGEYATGHYDLAAILRFNGKLPDAREHAEIALPLIRRMGDRQTESLVNEELCNISVRLSEFETALEYGNRALTLARSINDLTGIAYDLIQLGDIYENLGKTDDACKSRSEAIPLAKEMGHARTTELEEWVKERCGAQLASR